MEEIILKMDKVLSGQNADKNRKEPKDVHKKVPKVFFTCINIMYGKVYAVHKKILNGQHLL